MEDSYSTYDIGIAATFAVIGIPLKAMEWDKNYPKGRRGRVVFRFLGQETSQTTLTDYLCGKLLVDPQSLITKMNEYRRIIYNKEGLPDAGK